MVEIKSNLSMKEAWTVPLQWQIRNTPPKLLIPDPVRGRTTRIYRAGRDRSGEGRERAWGAVELRKRLGAGAGDVGARGGFEWRRDHAKQSSKQWIRRPGTRWSERKRRSPVHGSGFRRGYAEGFGAPFCACAFLLPFFFFLLPFFFLIWVSKTKGRCGEKKKNCYSR